MASAMPVMGAVPEFERVSERLVWEPTAIGPKLRPVGDICRRDWMAVPLSATVSGAVVAELAMERVPVREPVWVGVKVIWAVQVAFAASVAPVDGHVPLATV